MKCLCLSDIVIINFYEEYNPISGILAWKSTKPTHITQAGDCMRKHFAL